MKKRTMAVIAVLLVIAAGLVVARARFCTPAGGDLKDELQRLVEELEEKNKAVRNCVLAVEKGDGSLAWSGAAGLARRDGQVPMGPDTPIYCASITKLFTATAVMRLCEEGRLALDDPMARYLPPALVDGIHVYQGHDYSRQITIAQLLSHTSGIADYYGDQPAGGKSLFEVFLDDPGRGWTVAETIDWARTRLEPKFAPGTDAAYSDTNYQLLGKIIEAVTAKELHVVFEDLFFVPLGLEHTWMVGRSAPLAPAVARPADIYHRERVITAVRANGSYWADGGLVSTAGDCIAFLKALNEGRLVAKDTLRAMHAWHDLQFPLQYGYGTMRFGLPRGLNRLMKVPPLWGHSGSSGSFLYYCEELDLYMAGTLNQTRSPSQPFRLMLEVMRAVTDKCIIEKSQDE